jgi:uncharacterized protein YqeY
MDLNVRIEKQMVAAAKARDKARLSTLRMLKTALHNKEIDLMRQPNEAETMQILSQMVKQRKDSIEQFAKGGRQDLVDKEQEELKILQEFMPAQMSDDEVEALIKELIAETGAVSIKDIGKVMKMLMSKIAGRADGKSAGEKVKELLSQ